MPRLRSFASLWTLTDHPGSLDDKLRLIRDAGFDGVGGHALPEIADAARRHGLAFIAYVVLDRDNFAGVLEDAAKLAPSRVNAFFGTHETLPEDAARDLVAVFAKARDLGLGFDLETHRATCTENPEKIATITAHFSELTGETPRFSHDFSHPAVVKHLFAPEFAARLTPDVESLRVTRQMHFRPFNGHHCQIPVTDGSGNLTAPARDWLDFVTPIVAAWRDAVPADADLWWCPELGPVSSGYALPGFPDVWADAQVVKRAIDEL